MSRERKSAATPERLPGSTVQSASSSRVNDLTEAKVESDAASLGRIVYWGFVLGLAGLLIGQPSRAGTYSDRAARTGIVVLSVAGGHFLVKKWLQRRVKRQD